VSVRTFPSTLISRCLTIAVTSRPVNAYFNLLRRKITRGKDSRSLWGPGDGRGAWREDDMSNGRLQVVYSRRYHSVCRASTRMALQGASNAFWVHEPRQRRKYQRNGRRVSVRYSIWYIHLTSSHSDNENREFVRRMAIEMNKDSKLTMMGFLRGERPRRRRS